MNTHQNSLSLFHPLIAQWFSQRIGQPTDVQLRAWPKIANGEHVLITAPTGSGKTLTAFLWAINQFITGKWESGYTRLLYVSPLKALNNDIQRNLILPLGELKQVFEQSKANFPDIQVLTRSGDTPQTDRRRMLRRPPEILITTPESLNLLLSSVNGQQLLTGLTTVILDEIHAVIGNKRGTHLITAVDRLVFLSGEFQRISLSATIKSLSTASEFVGGFITDGDDNRPHYTARPVSIVQSNLSKQYALQIQCPEEDTDIPIDDPVWYPIVRDLMHRIKRNRSTLVFTNSRRLCENIAYRVNINETHPIAYAHHGSLSREIRTLVEQKLKAGELRAIVATSSLEMGIDIGDLDEVVLIQTPFTISSAIQRIGRAGHQVGEVSRGTLYPTHSHDFLYAAVLARAVLGQDIEMIKPVQCPLDVLAQILVSMIGVETWDMNTLFKVLKTSYPYRHLSRNQYDLVLNMLAGRYEDSRIRELKPRISIDRLDNTVCAQKGALMALYMSGGTIPNRGYFKLRHSENSAVIGELDEEFVWEARIGDVFSLGTQSWKIQRITHNDVFVSLAKPKDTETPFWKNEALNRDFHYSSHIAAFLETANLQLEKPEFMEILRRDFFMDETSVHRLVDFLNAQKQHTRCDLPHRHHLLLEVVHSGPGAVPGNQLVLHTLWGGRINRPLAIAMDAAWEERFGQQLEIFSGNDSIVIHLPHDVEAHDILSLVTSSTVEILLKKRLEGTGFFGARFRECAGRSLLITGNTVRERMPLWMNRLRSQKLLNTVQQYEDFPILLETWRTCLQDEFDLENLKLVLDELASGKIKHSVTTTHLPSPFARGMSRNQINEFMYRNDQPVSQKRSNLQGNLFEEVVFSPGLRPAIPQSIVEEFEQKKQRLSPGYAPQSSRDLIDWIKDRLFVPLPEWEALLNAMKRDLKSDPETVVSQMNEKIAYVFPAKADNPLIAAWERVPVLMDIFYPGIEDAHVKRFDETTEGKTPAYSLNREGSNRPEDADERNERFSALLGEWLQYYGPRTPVFIQNALGLPDSKVKMALEDLLDSHTIIQGRLVIDGMEENICDSENFEILLRLNRRIATPQFEPLPTEHLTLFLAHYQGLTRPKADIEDLFQCIEQLLCLPFPAYMWESEFFPSRFSSYNNAWLDTLIQEAHLRWIGYEKQKTAFCFEPDLDMIQAETEIEQEAGIEKKIDNPLDALFSSPTSRYDFGTLLSLSKCSSSKLSKQLWQSVWQGKVTNDTFTALRRGIEHRFNVSGIENAQNASGQRYKHRSRKGRFNAWKQSTPFSGNWIKVPYPGPAEDLIDIEERKKERVRVLLDRYGILFREILEKELSPFRWFNIFRSLRLMELSGEVLSGYFFKDIPGPQFTSPHAFQVLQSTLPEDKIYWINATDPVSVCGLQVNAFKRSLPSRVTTTHLVYRGSRLVLVSKRNGKSLNIHVPPDDPDFQEYLCSLRHLLYRGFQPLRKIRIEVINGEDAAKSPYVEPLKRHFDVVVEFKTITLYRKII